MPTTHRCNTSIRAARVGTPVCKHQNILSISERGSVRVIVFLPNSFPNGMMLNVPDVDSQNIDHLTTSGNQIIIY